MPHGREPAAGAVEQAVTASIDDTAPWHLVLVLATTHARPVTLVMLLLSQRMRGEAMHSPNASSIRAL